MKKKDHRVGCTTAQRAELWDRWHKGESLNAIGREFGKPSSCFLAHLSPTSGISPIPKQFVGRSALPYRQAGHWRQLRKLVGDTAADKRLQVRQTAGASDNQVDIFGLGNF
jgi:hypothetical protein